MASEHAHKIDGAVRKLRAVMDAFDMKGTNRATMLNAINTIETLRTRPAPAATDMGLVTVAKLGGINGVMLVRHIENLRPEAQAAYRDELVRRSQAVELLAAEIRRERDLAAKQLSEVVDRMSDDYLALKADNAAVSAALGALDNALAVIGGCGDGNCIVVRPKGQHTNGGCRCFQDRMKMQRFAFAMNQFRDVVARVCEASK